MEILCSVLLPVEAEMTASIHLTGVEARLHAKGKPKHMENQWRVREVNLDLWREKQTPYVLRQ